MIELKLLSLMFHIEANLSVNLTAQSYALGSLYALGIPATVYFLYS
jgi:hypothetical protein